METSVATQTDLANMNIGPDEVGHSTYVVADDAWYTAQFQGRGLDKWAAGTPGDPDTVLESLAAAIYPGSGRAEQGILVRAEIPASSTVTIPGPAVGDIRIVDRLLMSTATTTAGAVDLYVDRSPSDIYLTRDQAIALSTGVGSLPPTIGIEAGEALIVETKAPATGAVVVMYIYRDFPAADYTVVRTTVSGTTPVEIIPAAPAGFVNRIAAFGNMAVNGVVGPRTCALFRNDDTASVQMEFFVGAALLTRLAALTANNWLTGSFQTPIVELPIRTAALSVALRATVATRPVQVLIVYETLPDT